MSEREDETDALRGGYELRRRRRGRSHPAGAPASVDVRDVNERLLIAGLREQELAATLEAERARLVAILASIGDAVLVVDRDGHPLLTNAAYTQLMETLAVVPALMTADGQPLTPAEAPWSRAARGDAFAIDFGGVDADWTRRWWEARGRPIGRATDAAGGVVVIRDISACKGLEGALQYQALHDALTGLPNRTLLHDRLDQALRSARRGAEPLALLLLDLDHFKEINDTHGHQAGDRLLQEVTTRLSCTVRASDTVARLGGDEFAILLPETSRDGAVGVAGAIRASLAPIIMVEGQGLHVAASIGIALMAGRDTDARLLLRHADVAMYDAKRTRSGHAIYTVARDRYSSGALALASELGAAITAGQLAVRYQPKVRLGMPPHDTGGAEERIDGVEALVRWVHPEHGLIPPDHFIPLAERTGLIIPLTTWVLDAALRQAQLWRRAGQALSLAVNLSMANLRDPDLPATIARLVTHYAFPATLLRLELTESMIMADPPGSAAALTRLVDLGAHVAIDDFGTGYSSLAYLKQLPVDEIKIDRSFVEHASAEATDTAIIRAIVALGHGLGMRIVAEGVEDQATLDLVERLGCDAAQGYHVSRPLAATDVLDWVHHTPWGPEPGSASSIAPPGQRGYD